MIGLLINAPVLPKYRYDKGDAKLKLIGGPSFNYLYELGQARPYSNEGYDSKYSYKNRKISKQNILEIELIGGLGLEMPIYAHGIISFDYHNHYPINSVGTVNGDKVKFVSSVFGITLMYKPQD
ncbi:MAG: hypothetical protein ACI8ZO_000435 [Flavobacteriales bacterium]